MISYTDVRARTVDALELKDLVDMLSGRAGLVERLVDGYGVAFPFSLPHTEL